MRRYWVQTVWLPPVRFNGESDVDEWAASWWDHGRDLLYLINQFQDDMPLPLVGVGHSVGASHLYATDHDVLCRNDR